MKIIGQVSASSTPDWSTLSIDARKRIYAKSLKRVRIPSNVQTYSVDEISQLLGLSFQEIYKQLQDGFLFGYYHEEKWHFPVWQIENRQVLPCVYELQQISRRHWDNYQFLAWLYRPNSSLSNEAPYTQITEVYDLLKTEFS